MARVKDRRGEVYGRLTAVLIADRRGLGSDREVRWACRCECGTWVVVRGSSLGKATLSCGCLAKESARASLKALRANPEIEARRRERQIPSARMAARRLNATQVVPTGSAHWAWAGDSICYASMHQRLAREKGHASKLQCSDCPVDAGEWSHNPTCDEVVIDAKRGLPYCTHLECYIPRCVPCHRSFDRRKVA